MAERRGKERKKKDKKRKEKKKRKSIPSETEKIESN
jgi:hypothetical protein